MLLCFRIPSVSAEMSTNDREKSAPFDLSPTYEYFALENLVMETQLLTQACTKFQIPLSLAVLDKAKDW